MWRRIRRNVMNVRTNHSTLTINKWNCQICIRFIDIIIKKAFLISVIFVCSPDIMNIDSIPHIHYQKGELLTFAPQNNESPDDVTCLLIKMTKRHLSEESNGRPFSDRGLRCGRRWRTEWLSGSRATSRTPSVTLTLDTPGPGSRPKCVFVCWMDEWERLRWRGVEWLHCCFSASPPTMQHFPYCGKRDTPETLILTFNTLTSTHIHIPCTS